ncbi:hypothetical protein PUN28_004043 [Cardiocondyla obscurior]|uniref:Uncharacterized protein n=1 Tax=Cardiocondyla obscurior TaxID=286306 RepID=A0AAW2GLI0_9HYME
MRFVESAKIAGLEKKNKVKSRSTNEKFYEIVARNGCTPEL